MAHKDIILIILHDGLQEFITADGVFDTIRSASEGKEIALLTSKPMQLLAEGSGYFDHVWVDPMWQWYQVKHWWAFRKKLKGLPITLFVDLQNSKRTSWYFRLLGRKKPLWCGAIEWCAYPHIPSHLNENIKEEERVVESVIETYTGQLQAMGLPVKKADIMPNLNWLRTDLHSLDDQNIRFVLMAPGIGGHRRAQLSLKDNVQDFAWHYEHCISLIEYLAEKHKVMTILIGEKEDEEVVEGIMRRSVAVKPTNMLGKLTPFEIAEMSRKALISIGNAQDVMYIPAYAKQPCLLFYNDEYELHRWLPDYPTAEHILAEHLPAVMLEEVQERIAPYVNPAPTSTAKDNQPEDTVV